MSQNKPLNEYGDLHSVHHIDKQYAGEAEKAALKALEEPARLVVADGPGNLVIIKWSKGDLPIPFNCEGSWNHKGKAQEAIDGALHQLSAEAAQALADEEAITAAKEVAAEKERIQAEIDKEREQMEAAAGKAEVEASKPVVEKTATASKTKK